MITTKESVDPVLKEYVKFINEQEIGTGPFITLFIGNLEISGWLISSKSFAELSSDSNVHSLKGDFESNLSNEDRSFPTDQFYNKIYSAFDKRENQFLHLWVDKIYSTREIDLPQKKLLRVQINIVDLFLPEGLYPEPIH